MRIDPDLERLWSVTCFVVHQGFRRQGVMYELAAATVEYGRQVSARVLEGYPTEPRPPCPSGLYDTDTARPIWTYRSSGEVQRVQ